MAVLPSGDREIADKAAEYYKMLRYNDLPKKLAIKMAKDYHNQLLTRNTLKENVNHTIQAAMQMD